MQHVRVLAAMLAVTAGGCAGPKNPQAGLGEVGSIEATVTLPEGLSIESVDFRVSGIGVNTERTIEVGMSSVLQLRVDNLSFAEGYTLALGAQTTDVPPLSCVGGMTFDVVDSGLVSLALPLVCGSDAPVTIDNADDIEIIHEVDAGTVGAEYDEGCPRPTGIAVLPLEAAVGEEIQLSAFDVPAEAEVTWSGPGGTFADPTLNPATYTCTSAGQHVLTFTPTLPGCSHPIGLTVEVVCRD